MSFVAYCCLIILPSDVFERVAQGAGNNPPRVEMSFLEIYIETIYDLLAEDDVVRTSPP